jgi:hypothetical protein
MPIQLDRSSIKIPISLESRRRYWTKRLVNIGFSATSFNRSLLLLNFSIAMIVSGVKRFSKALNILLKSICCS